MTHEHGTMTQNDTDNDDTERCELLPSCDEQGYVVLHGTPDDFVVCKYHFNSVEDSEYVIRYVDTDADQPTFND